MGKAGSASPGVGWADLGMTATLSGTLVLALVQSVPPGSPLAPPPVLAPAPLRELVLADVASAASRGDPVP